MFKFAKKKALLHNFYIPVMGTGFTIDTPLKVAKYGISSVLSLVDDVLIEQMRKYWCTQIGESYIPITNEDPDCRSHRITAYLNLLDDIVKRQISHLKSTPFVPGSEITRYFEMLPQNDLKKSYAKMLATENLEEKLKLQATLRDAVKAGSIDVNIMTKLNRQKRRGGKLLPPVFADALTALRGFAESNLDATIIFSAGFNPNLYGYIASFADFLPDANGYLKKKVCLKVSDYRSATIQGKYLAKHGVWVSEYRIESPLNCGGHAFVNDGMLLGPVLEEFKQRKNELITMIYGFYKNALSALKYPTEEHAAPPEVRITAQGGIGTSEEHAFLLDYYQLDATGWGTPFLLVPEATNVDNEHLGKLINASDSDVYLSDSSPMGVPFWNLRNSSSELARLLRIKKGKPGSACVKGYVRLNNEFGEPALCIASREYQQQKLAQIASRSDISDAEKQNLQNEVLVKSCICHDLAGGATVKLDIDKHATTAICPGPNIVNFFKIASLSEMIDHIYGRCNLLKNIERPHVFIRELILNIEYMMNEIKKASLDFSLKSPQKLQELKQNLLKGIDYYQTLAAQLVKDQQDKFLLSLNTVREELEKIAFSDIAHC